MHDAVVRADADVHPVDLERVYREQGPKMQRALLLFTGDRDVADDAVAEAFAQALARGSEMRSHPAGFGAWRSASPAVP